MFLPTVLRALDTMSIQQEITAAFTWDVQPVLACQLPRAACSISKRRMPSADSTAVNTYWTYTNAAFRFLFTGFGFYCLTLLAMIKAPVLSAVGLTSVALQPSAVLQSSRAHAAASKI